MKFFVLICLFYATAVSSRVLQQRTFTETSTSGDADASASSTISFDPPTTSSSRSFSGRLDVYILVDASEDMSAALTSLSSNAGSFVRDLFGLTNSVRVGVGRYRATTSATPFKAILSLSSDRNAVTNVISNGLSVFLDRTPRSQLQALRIVATDSSIGFRQNSQRIVVWLGNTAGANPAVGVSEGDARRALRNNRIQVAATDVGSLDSTGQATRITEATDGILQTFSTNSAMRQSRSGEGSATARASGLGVGNAARTRVVGDMSQSSSSSGVTLPDAIVASVRDILSV
eukprot:g5558.t1